MKGKRFTEEQIVAILQEHEAGVPVAELCRKHAVGKDSIYRWRVKYGGMQVNDVRKLKQLEDENAKLKRLVAEMALETAAIKEVLSKKW